MSRRKRDRVRWEKGTVLWQVPIRFYDDPVPPAERCTVVSDDSVYDYEDEFSTYALHDGYGHEVYLNPDDLYETVEACHAEIQQRRAAKKAEHNVDVDKMMARMEELRAEGINPFKAMQESWAEGDKRAPGRFKDKKRFARSK